MAIAEPSPLMAMGDIEFQSNRGDMTAGNCQSLEECCWRRRSLFGKVQAPPAGSEEGVR